MKGNEITESVYAKHPDAAIREPLSIRFSTNFGNDTLLKNEFEDSFRFGMLKPLSLPPSVLTSFESIGPDWFSRQWDGGSLTISPAAGKLTNEPVKVVATNSTTPAFVVKGFATAVAAGTDGARVVVALEGGLSMTWRVPKVSGTGTTEFTFAPGGFDATSVARALRFLEALRVAETMTLVINGRNLTGRLNANEMELDRNVIDLADDLAHIEKELDVRFSFPEHFPDGDERALIRTIRRVLEGRCMIYPGIDGMSFTLNGNDSDALRQSLGGPGQLIAQQAAMSLSILGEDLLVPEVTIYHHAVVAKHGKAHLEALRNGRAEGRKVNFEPRDGVSGFRIFSHAKVAPDFKVVPEPWGVAGMNEHPSLESLRGGLGETLAEKLALER